VSVFYTTVCKNERPEKEKVCMNEFPLYNHHLEVEFRFIFLKRETQCRVLHLQRKEIHKGKQIAFNCNNVKQRMKQKSKAKKKNDDLGVFVQ
jgi:hypothetical protein